PGRAASRCGSPAAHSRPSNHGGQRAAPPTRPARRRGCASSGPRRGRQPSCRCSWRSPLPGRVRPPLSPGRAVLAALRASSPRQELLATDLAGFPVRLPRRNPLVPLVTLHLLQVGTPGIVEPGVLIARVGFGLRTV